MKDKSAELLKQLKLANEECWNARIALHDLGQKYAPLCIQLMVEMRHVPKLINHRIEKRMKETNLDVLHPDFWDTDMIMALAEHYNLMEEEHASA